MTTIVTDGVTVACDGLMTFGAFMASGSQTKIFRANNEVYGIAGECAADTEIRKWIKGGCSPEDLPDLEERDFSAIRVNTKKIYYLDQYCFEWLEMKAPFGIGSGGDYAVVALRAGATIKKAVQVAIDSDVYSGGKIYTLKV